MPTIKLYELGPTRSARCRWTLLEAGLAYESIGNSPDVIRSDELRKIHPLGKLPAAMIDGRPLFESAAIAAAIADLVPDRGLIAPPGSWSRTLHDQWVCFALSEMEPFVQSTEVNSIDFVIPVDQHVPEIHAQNATFYKKAAAALDTVLGQVDFLIDNQFSVTDIILGYTINFGDELGWIEQFPNLVAYQERLFDRPHCTLVRHRP